MEMPVPGGRLVESEILPGQVYVLEEAWQDRFSRVLQAPGVTGIRLSQSMGWAAEDLAFLADLPALKSVEIYHPEVRDVSVLQTQTELQHIGLGCPFSHIDYSAFPALTHLAIDWRPAAKTLLQCCRLRYLHINRYPAEDLGLLEPLQELERLVLFSRKLVSVSGVERLSRLRRLEFAYCSALQDLHSLASCRTLEELVFTTCRKVSDISALAGLTTLKVLKMENCHMLRSASPLASCTRLEAVYLIATGIEDGDTSIFLEIPNLKAIAFPQNRHYSHSAEQIRQALALE